MMRFVNNLLRLSPAAALVLALVAFPATYAATVAYWRFEDGTADTDVTHIAGAGNTYSADILDQSGNNNHLSTWITGGFAGYGYRANVPAGTIEATGQTNNLSVRNTGGAPGMFTQTGSQVSTMTPAAWTLEASFKLENGGFRTIVGRDSRGAATINGDLAALYLQALPNNGLAIKFADVSGFWHEVVAPNGTITTFDNTANPSGSAAPWYNVAAVSNGSTLSLYLADATAGTGYQLLGSTDMTLSGSPNTALTAGTEPQPPASGDWDPGNWTVGRGLYAGGHGDRAWGFIDEVRISDSALAVADFLHTPNVPPVRLEVNTTSGAVQFVNDTANGITFDYYEITSAHAPGALNKTGWSSLDDQGVGEGVAGDYNVDGNVDAADYTVWRDGLGSSYVQADYDVWKANFGQSGSGGGGGWVEAGGSSANILSEVSLGDYTLDANGSLSLGTAFNPAVFGTGVDGDLVFKVGLTGGTILTLPVYYVTAGALGAGAVPEPTSVAIVVMACGLVSIAYRSRRQA